LRKKMDVGSKILRESKICGNTIRVRAVAVGSEELAKCDGAGRGGEREAISKARC
jgi:hypothetical protein